MLNIPELEQRWLRYKIKSTLPYAIIAISLVVIIIIISSFLGSDDSTEDTKKNINHTNKKEVINYNKTLVEKNTSYKNQNDEESLKLAPSMNFMQNMQDYGEPYYQHTTHKKNVAKTKTTKQIKKRVNHKPVEVAAPKQEVVKKQERIVNTRPKKILINRKDTKNDIEGIIKRFKKSNNPMLSLFIAKRYYASGNYTQAYNYALITNQINKEIEESWLIFTKSLVKLGKKQLAMRTLREYINVSHSENAQILLNEIRSGKFQ